MNYVHDRQSSIKNLNKNSFKDDEKSDKILNNCLVNDYLYNSIKKKNFFRKWFLKKKENKLIEIYKSDLEKSEKFIRISKKIEKKSDLNKQTQVGNGLVSLKNLNFYLESNKDFNLINRFIKRIGLLNQYTQTDFPSFNIKCVKIIDFSQLIIDQFIDLVPSFKKIEYDYIQNDNESFNFIEYKNNLKNKRNISIQRCVDKRTVGTQTKESITYLNIFYILKKILNNRNLNILSKIDFIFSNDNDTSNFLDLYQFILTLKNLKLNYQLLNLMNSKKLFLNYSLSTNKIFLENYLERKLEKKILENNKLENKEIENLINENLENSEENYSKKLKKKLSNQFISFEENLIQNIYKKCKSESDIQNKKELLAQNKKLRKFNSQLLFNEIIKKLNKFEYIDIETRMDNWNRDNLLSPNSEKKLEEYLKNLLIDTQQTYSNNTKIQKRNVGSQTLNDWISDELPEYAARCPSLRKKELIYSNNLFDEVDLKAIEAPNFTDLSKLSSYLTESCKNDLFKVRAFYKWLTNNISLDYNYNKEINQIQSIQKNEEAENNQKLDQQLKKNSSAILTFITKKGCAKHFTELFKEMCKNSGIRCKIIQGLAKNYDYRPGHVFLPEDIVNPTNIHYWVAVFVLGNWHLIDITWSTGYIDPVGIFQRKFNEFFFLTDPEQLAWTHFPYNNNEKNYERWQLLDNPISLEKFNNLPKITASFFDFNLKFRSKISNPITFKIQTEIKVSSHEPIRYKFKLYSADEIENCSLNHYAFCQLKEERTVASFVISPPVEGRFYLKIFAKYEKDMQDQNAANLSLSYVSTILLECIKTRKYQSPYPLNELPWGLAQAFYTYQMKLLNQNSAIISTWGGKRKLTLQCNEPMLLTYQIFEADGQEMDSRTIISRDDENSSNLIILNISPPKVGMFKLMIFGMPKPKQKGKWRLPLLATFLIDCRLAKIQPFDEDPPPLTAALINNLSKK